MNKYESYKDSGVEWIGKIPDGWLVKRLKYITSPIKELSIDGQEELLSVTENRGIVPRKEIASSESNLSRSDDLIGYRIVRKGNLVNNIMLVWKRGLGVSEYDGIVSPAYSVFSFSNVCNPRFFDYLLRTDEYISEFRRRSTGVVMSRLRLYDDAFGDTDSLLPPLAEQSLIARYLDKKTEQIDLLVEKIKKKIELLKEHRTSLINHYVTKGLDPNFEMKDSGVEWIGKIPKHWDVKKLKRLVEIETGRDPSAIYFDDGPYEVLGTGGVIGRTHSYMWNEDSLILGRKGTIDKPFLQKSPFWISDVVYYTKPTSHLMVDYIWYLFTQIDFSYYKYGSTLPSMSKDEYGNMKFPVPPDDEYLAIANALESVWKRIEHLVSLYKNKIDKLSEYRQSLISSVVTGKVRVTEDMV